MAMVMSMKTRGAMQTVTVFSMMTATAFALTRASKTQTAMAHRVAQATWVSMKTTVNNGSLTSLTAVKFTSFQC